jgi:uncharacterized BrkB/YihY/UPF0761 family membrane protein
MHGFIGGVARRWSRSPAGETFSEFGALQASNLALALAMSIFLAMFPLLLGILAIVGFLAHDPGARSTIQAALVGAFPADARVEIAAAVDGVRQHAGILAIAGVAGLVWSGSAMFSTMEFALSQIFRSPQRSWVRQRIMSLAMMIFLAILIVAVVLANSIVGLVPIAFMSPLLAVGILFVGVLGILRLVPRHTRPVLSLWPGALISAVLIEAVALLFPLYERVTGGLNTYGRQFGLFFLLATWLVFLAEFLLLGGVVGVVLARRKPVAAVHGWFTETNPDL